jgi:nucleotide-binding universal stress UspA family protein
MVTVGHGPHVLVGYDGSEQAEQALRWGVEEARLRCCPLTICHAWHWPYPDAPQDAAAFESVRSLADGVLDRGARIAHGQAPGLAVYRRFITGPAASGLLAEARQAELIVLGSHGVGGFAGLWAGSVALQVSAYAHCPVVVFRPPVAALPRVVVGVDGSSPGDAALAFAFEEAALRGWELQAVCGCWELPAVPGSEMALYRDLDRLRQSGSARLKRAVLPWREKYPHVPTWTSLRMAEPRHALLETMDRAALLVIGDRGEGGLPGLRLGTVSAAMLYHATCPVAVVHAEHQD